MSITALEIKQKTFARTIRGYDVAEVNAFLSMLSTEWEHQVVKAKELERELKQLTDKLEHYERIEATLHETLQTARENAEQRLENARRDAQNKIDKAEMEGEHILQQARQQRQEIRQSTLKLLERREEIIGGIKSYLDMAQRSVQAFENDTEGLYNLPKEQEPSASAAKNAGPAPSPKSGSAPQGGNELDDLINEID